MAKDKDLRRKAEALLKKGKRPAKAYIKDVEKLVEELGIHQIELEMQAEELREANLRTEKERKKYQTLYLNAPIAYLTLNQTGNILQLNQEASKLIDLPLHAVKNTSVFPYIEHNSKQVFTALFRRALNSDEIQQSEIQIKTPAGKKVTVSLRVQAYLDSEQQETLCRCTLTDISAQKRAENELAESRECYKQLADLTFEGILIHQNGMAQLANQTFLKMFGYREAEILGKNILPLILHPESLATAKQNIAKKQAKAYEVLAIRKSGEIFPAEIEARNIEINGKKQRVTAFRDLTERRKVQENLKQANEEYAAINEELLATNDELELEIQDRKKAQQKLAQSEEKYRLLAENSSDMIVVFENYQITYISPAVKKILGYTPEEFLKINHLDLIHPDERPEIEERMAYRIENNITDPITYTYRQKHKDGCYRWLETKEKSKQILKNKIITVLNARDISRRKKAEEDLKNALYEKQMIAENQPAIIWKAEIDPQGNFINTYISERVNQLLALPPKTIRNDWNKYFAYVEPEYMPKIQETFAKGIKKTGQTYALTYPVRKANGEKAWFETSGTVYIYDDKKLAFGYTRDISEKLKAEKDLKESEERFRTLVNHSVDAIRLVNEKGEIIFVNKAHEKLTGYPANDVLGKPIWYFIYKLTPPEYKSKKNYLRIKNEVKKLLAQEKSEALEKAQQVYMMTKQGKKIPTNSSLFRIKTSAGNRFGTIVRDMSQEEESRKRLEKSNALHRALSRSATDMLNMQSLNEIYHYITQTMSQHYPNAATLFVTTDEARQKAKLVNLSGLNRLFLKKVFDLTGYNPIGKEFDLLPGHQEKYKTGQVVQFQGGLSAFGKGAFPGFTARAIENLLGIHEIYAVGIKKDENLYAVLHFFNLKPGAIANHSFIEAFVKQAGIVIERKIIEKALKESEEQFRLLSENSPDGVTIINDEGKIIEWNKAQENITGLTRDEVKNQYLWEISKQISPKNAPAEKIAQHAKKQVLSALQTGKGDWLGKSLEYDYQVSENEIKTVEAVHFLIGSENNKMICALIRDITKRKAQEKELRELNATKDKFFSIISHDLRTPFSNLLGFSQLMQTHLKRKDYDRLKLYADSIHSAANRGNELLLNLLTWSRTQRGKITFNPKQLDAVQIVSNIVELLESAAHEKQIEIKQAIEPGLNLYADRQMLETILRNLLSNAIKFTPRGGSIRIVVLETQQGTEFSIADTGVGIPPESKDKLFALDQTLSTQGTENETGTGLGLILCKEFVQQHKGEIRVESQPGKGSTFSFVIPKKLK